MIALHETTLALLITMYDPVEFNGVLAHIEEFYSSWISSGSRGYPFLNLQFSEFPLGEIPIDDPPKTFRMN